jgi:hypothetical protein
LTLVQSWIGDPRQNYGVLIANSGAATDGADFYSREHTTSTQRPKLTISYLPVAGPELEGDLNLDNQVDAEDIDLLFSAFAAGSDEVAFDLDGSGTVDAEDLDYLVHDILATQFGDANLDGVVDGVDFSVWQSHRFQGATGWASGDFNGDRVTDGRDFGVWNRNKFTGGMRAEARYAAVPRAASVVASVGGTAREKEVERNGFDQIPAQDAARALGQRIRRLGDVSGGWYDLFQRHRRA